MLEVVFNQSAYGSMRYAQSLMKHSSVLSGKLENLYCFPLFLSVGEISENKIGIQRQHTLEVLSVFDSNQSEKKEIQTLLQQQSMALESLLKRYSNGENIRIWYSNNPDDLCGMYWLLAQLQPLKYSVEVYLVKLPEWENGKDGTVVLKAGWGEVAPDEWEMYCSLQRKTSSAFLTGCAITWKQLQKENASLRAVLNGQLVSVEESLYDVFILREIAAQPEEFQMAAVIGMVIGKYRLGICDTWIALRIQRMIDKGLLEVIEEDPSEARGHRKLLRKKQVFDFC